MRRHNRSKGGERCLYLPFLIAGRVTNPPSNKKRKFLLSFAATAMAGAKASLDSWRKFFSCAKSDIFELIEKAIVVAAIDFPAEFKDRRNRITEMIFAPHLPLCSDCHRAELQVVGNGDEGRVEEESSSNFGERDDTRILGEAMRIKEVLRNHRDEPDSVLCESLRSLQLMRVSVETLMATEIGRTVNALRKHDSDRIRKLVRALIDDWRVVVDQWVESKSLSDSGLSCDEVSDTSKMEAAKKKLREGYRRAERERKRRMVQVIELGDVPVESQNERRRGRKRLGSRSGLVLGG